jgi:hypothetical protein
VLILALLGGGAVVGVNQYQAPANAARQFCTALVGQDYMVAYALLTSQLQAQYTQAAFTAASQTLDKVEGNVTACGEAVGGNGYTYALFGSTATIAATITRAQSGPLSGALHLVNDSGWKIAGIATSLLGVNLASLQTLASYCGALQQQDYATAYAYLNSTLQSQVSQSTFSKQAALHDQVDGAVTGCAITGFGSGNNDTTTKLVVSITRGRLGQVSGALSLDLESGSWKISSIASKLQGSDLSGLLVAQSFCTYMEAGKLSKAYSLTSAAFQSSVSLATFEADFSVPAGFAVGCTLRVSTYKFTTRTEAHINGTFTITGPSGAASLPVEFFMIKSGSEWRINNLQSTS